ncbi:MAG: hypothetical protein QW416_01715 [Candidatus Nitrosocaldaceae archaeon]
MSTLEFTIKSIVDQGRLLTLTLQQEIRTEIIDQAEIIRQRIDNIEGLDDDSKLLMKKILPALLASYTPKQEVIISPIQMNITITRQIYERLGSPRVGDTLNITISKKD